MPSVVYRLVLVSALVATGCPGRDRDPLAAQASPDGRFTLTPSMHEGSLIELTVREKSTGKVIDDVKTRDTDAMKWVAGWVDNTTYLFWGSDTRSAWVRHIDGTQSPVLPGAQCARLEALFEGKYHEHRGNCLNP